ncbi:hypothetical protein DYB32_005138 [Aphanomyces invadans]|uniref:Uncharacterized protein n=1 Tax=Aphanomyces invadans TaxID=157072 RepID=A0A418AVA9_9STRA|nr:hypothetical protein DYB32_005138 [Aphanomyces invadans]
MQLIALFESADEDKSGSVDEQEFRKLLVRMDICISDEEVDKLVVEVDTNNNGLIEWDEFVMFGLDVVFRLLEERKATSYNPKTYVVEVTITTTSPADGSTERQSYQAIGFSSREAKFKAAELALVKMRKMKPGFEFPAGVVPPTWDDWAFNNLNKGVASLKVLKTLVEKGFTPADNLVFMKRFSLHVSYLHVKHQNLDTALVFPNSTSLTTPWCRWVDEQVARGMDGALVLQQLCHGGYDSTKDPHFVQQLLQGKKNGAVPPVYDFWQCVQTGNLHETKLFVCAGQNVNEAKLDRHAKTLYTPLQLAAKLGYLNMVEYFLQHGAEVAAKNSFRRTALMFAARHGHPAVRTFDAKREYVRSCIINTNKSLNFLDEKRSFRGIVRALFADMMQAKLARNARPTFALAWLHEAVDLAYADHMGRTPLDLLLQRKHRPGSPKENRELEVTLQRARHRRRMNHAARRQLEQDAVKRGAFEENLLQQLPRQPEYKDAQSLNHFYENVNTGQLQLRIPDDVRAALAVRMQWFFRKQSARLLEKRGSWTMHKHAEKQRVFFYNTETGQYQWTKPTVVDGWANIPPNIKRTLDAVATPDSDDEDSDDSEQGEHREGIDQVSQKLLRVFEHQDAVTGGRVYYNTDTRQLTRDKPDAVLKDELKRQAYALLIKTADVHAVQEAIKASAQDATVQLVRRLTDEELSKQRDNEHWMNILQRARRRDTLTTLVKKEVVDDATRRLNQLNDAILRKFVDGRNHTKLTLTAASRIHADFATATMGYRDARVATEQRALMKARALGLFVSEKIVMAPSRASTEAMEFTEWLQREEAESHAVEDTDANPSESARRRIVRLVEDAAWRMDSHYALCFWGCRLWSLVGMQKADHEHDECKRRCARCSAVRSLIDW